MLNIKKEVIAWQSEALRGQEVGSPFQINLCTELTREDPPLNLLREYNATL